MVGKIPGTVFQRQGTGKWVARRRYIDANGKQRDHSVTCDTEKEAKQKLQDLHISIIRGGKLEAKEMKLSQWLETALREIYKPKLSGNTYALYKNFADNHAIALGHIPINKLTVQMLDNLINTRSTLGSRSKAHFRRFLIGALNHAVRRGKLTSNPAALTQLNDQPKGRRIRALTKEQAATLLEKTENTSMKAIFACQLMLGLRIGEALALMWTDLECKGVRASISIRQQLQRDRETGKRVLKPLKTERSCRQVAIPPPLLKMLEQLPRRGDLIFCTKKGTPFSYRNVQRSLEASAKSAKLEKVSTHMLRHDRSPISFHPRNRECPPPGLIVTSA